VVEEVHWLDVRSGYLVMICGATHTSACVEAHCQPRIEYSMKNICLQFLAAATLQGVVTQPSFAQQPDITPARAVQVTGIEGSKSSTNGYFVFTTFAPVAGCEAGFWSRVSDARYAANLARVNDALSTKVPIMVIADRAQLWPDSTDRVCRIVQLQ
jgi:hypothetical protein